MTGVQWAVLCLYARTLPPGPERRAVRRLCAAHVPARPSLALTAAAGLGLISRGRLTPAGNTAARSFLRREGLGL